MNGCKNVTKYYSTKNIKQRFTIVLCRSRGIQKSLNTAYCCKYLTIIERFDYKAGLTERQRRKTSLVLPPPPLSRLRDFHSIDSAQKDFVPSLQEVAETFVCAPSKRPERQWPLPKDRQRPQTFLFGQSGIRQPVFARSAILSKPASRMLSYERLLRCGSHPPSQFRPRWLRHLVRAGLPQQLRCGYRRCCSSAWS